MTFLENDFFNSAKNSGDKSRPRKLFNPPILVFTTDGEPDEDDADDRPTGPEATAAAIIADILRNSGPYGV